MARTVSDLRPHPARLAGPAQRLRDDPLHAAPLHTGSFEFLVPEQGLTPVDGRPQRRDRRADAGEQVPEDLAAFRVRARAHVRQARWRVGEDADGDTCRRVGMGRGLELLEP
ncbi:hypothetical protein AB0945_36930 [Streptomyces sp. NPDC005474]|uniref:hypothetical protein n=1 Tax=Streptomyces sp. NPDC005474 TaxID=3154878 RepID=UPI0034559759